MRLGIIPNTKVGKWGEMKIKIKMEIKMRIKKAGISLYSPLVHGF